MTDQSSQDSTPPPSFPDLALLVARGKERLRKARSPEDADEEEDGALLAAISSLSDDSMSWCEREDLDWAFLCLAAHGHEGDGRHGASYLQSGTPRSPEALGLAWSETTPEERLLAENLDAQILRHWLSASFYPPMNDNGPSFYDFHNPRAHGRQSLSDIALSHASEAPLLRRALRSKFLLNLLASASSAWNSPISLMGRVGNTSKVAAPFQKITRLAGRRIGSSKASAVTMLSGMGILAATFAAGTGAGSLGVNAPWIGEALAGMALTGFSSLVAGIALQCRVNLRGGGLFVDPPRLSHGHARKLLALAYPDFDKADFFDAIVLPGQKSWAWTIADKQVFVQSLSLLGLEPASLSIPASTEHRVRLGGKSSWTQRDRAELAAVFERGHISQAVTENPAPTTFPGRCSTTSKRAPRL